MKSWKWLTNGKKLKTMIKSITLLPGQDVFTNKLYKHKSKPVTFNFTDGINIITGRNANGKSVLLNLIAYNCGIQNNATYPRMIEPLHLHSLFSDFDKDWDTIDDQINKTIRNRAYPKSEIIWDGSIVHHLTEDAFSPDTMWRQIDGDSFRGTKVQRTFGGLETIQRFVANDSKGENATRVLFSLDKLNKNYDPPMNSKQVNDSWLKADSIFQDWINSKPKDGKPTLLIDELDSGLDVLNQYYYWSYIQKLAEEWQVIVVSHSIFAFKHKGNQIPLNKSFFKEVNKIKLSD